MVKPKVKASCVLLLVVLVLLQPTLGAAYTSTLIYSMPDKTFDVNGQEISVHDPGELYRSDASSEVAIGIIQEYDPTALACWGRKLTNDLNRHIVQCYNLDNGVILLTVDEGINKEILNFQMIKDSTYHYIVVATDKERLTRWTYAPDGLGNFAADPAAPVPTDHQRFNKNIAPATDAPIYYDYQAIAQRSGGTNIFTWSLPVPEIDPVTLLNTRNYLVKHRIQVFKKKATPTAAITALESLTKGLYFIYFHADLANILMIYGDYDKVLLYDVVAGTTALSVPSPIPSCRGPITMYDPASKNDLFASGIIGTVYRMTLTGTPTPTAVDIASSGSLLNTVSRIAGMRSVSMLRAFIVTFFESADMELVQTYDMFSEKITGPTPLNSMIGSTVTTSLVDNTLKLGMIYRSEVEYSGGIQTYALTLDKCVDTKRVSGVCSECPLGYTLDSVGTKDNQCFRNIESNLPRGPDPVNGGDYYCGVGCKDCSTDYRVCEDCTDPLFKRVQFSATNIRCLASVPKGYGQDLTVTTSVIYKACTADCLQCENDLLVCTDCRDKYFRTQATSTTPITCTATLTTGYGLDTTYTAGNPIYRPCTAGYGCATCPESITICATCTTSTDWRIKRDATNTKCENGAVVTPLDSFGRNKDEDVDDNDLYYTKCKDSNCDKCLNDYSVCTACSALYTLIKRSSTLPEISCVVTSSLPIDRYAPVYNSDATAAPVLNQCTTNGCEVCGPWSNICKECKTPLYLEKTVGTPDVYTCASTLTPAYGLVTPDAGGFVDLYIECETLCSVCTENQKECTQCAPNTNLRVDKGPNDIKCVAPVTNVDGFGRNKDAFADPDLYYSKCFYDQCTKCAVDYKRCTECSSGFTLMQISKDAATSEFKCVQTSTLPIKGYGIENAVLQPCLVDFCIDCHPNDIRVCKECERPRFLIKDNTNVYTCPNTLVPSQGYGLITPDVNGFIKEYNLCEMGCLECFDDRIFCTKCQPTFFRVYNGPNKPITTKCLDPAGGLPDKSRGRDPANDNSGDLYYQPCQQGSPCDTCSSDYKNCDNCGDATTSLAKHRGDSVYTCISNTIIAITPDLGLIVPGGPVAKYEACQISGCISCSDDNSASCKECRAGTFLHKDSANVLTCESTKKTGYGLDTNPPAGYFDLYLPCDSRCKTCADNYLECTKCNIDSDLRFNQGPNNIKCFVTGTAVPDGIGKDLLTSTLIDLYYVKCAYSDCKTCPDNIQVCTACTSATKVLKQLYREPTIPDVSCVPATSFNQVAGFGWKTPNARIEPCTEVKCVQCFTDIDTCQECASPKLLKKTTGTPDTYTCTDIDPNTDKYGLVVPDAGGFIRLYEPCAAGCGKCFANSQVCNKCTDPLWARIYYDPTSIICKDQTVAGFNEKVGRNEYLVPGTTDLFFTKCEQTNCDKCLGNYESCEKCTDANYVLYRTSHEPIFICVDPSSIPDPTIPVGPEVPLASPIVYKPCADANCRDCSSDYTKCKECFFDFFLERASSTANTVCSKPLTAKYGLVDPPLAGLIFLYQPCDDTDCEKCVKNFKECTECTDPTYLRLNKGVRDITCVAGPASTTTVDNGLGRNQDDDNGAADLYYSKCFYDFCAECLDDYKVCTSCTNGGDSLFKISRVSTIPDVKCVPDATVTKGYGFVTVDERIEPCYDSNCLQCDSQNYKICKECASPFFLKFDGTDYSCDGTLVSADGYGLDKSAATATANFIELYIKCPADCERCFDNTAVCTKCVDPTTHYRVAYGLNDVQCKAIAGFTGAYGRNKYLVPDIANDKFLTQCEQAACDQCLSNYEDCEKCAATNVLVKQTTQQDIYTCTPAANVPAVGAVGIGLLVPTNADGQVRYEPCVTVGCENCLADNKKCVECDEDFFMKKDAAGVTTCETSLTTLSDASYGLVIPQVGEYVRAYEACEGRCKTCITNNKVCTACLDTADFRVEYAELDVQCKTAAVPGYGPNTARNIGGSDKFNQKCKWANCIGCINNYDECTTCAPNNLPINFGSNNIECRMSSEVPPGYGLSGSTSYQKCTTNLPNTCVNCFDDNSECKECMRGYYLKRAGATTLTCEADTTALAGYGLHSLAGNGFVNVYDPCFEGTTCVGCLRNYKICEDCQNGLLLHLKPDFSVATCEISAIRGYGLVNTYLFGDKYYETCLDTLCAACDDDKTICQECLAQNGAGEALFRAFVMPEFKCLTQTALTAAGYGYDADVNYYVKCEENCKECFADVKICTLCEDEDSDTNKLYLYQRPSIPTRGTCVIFTQIEAGYGIDTNAGISSVRPCDPACLTCQADYSICPECNQIDSYTVLTEDLSKSCALKSFVDAGGFRLIQASNAYIHCRRNCKSCDANDNCETCYTGTQDYKRVQLKGSSIYCMPLVEIPLGYIPNDVGIYVLCNPACATCELNQPTICKTCPNGRALWHQSATVVTCERPELVADGYGLRSADGHYVACEIVGCSQCHGNYQKCDQCKYGLKLWIDGSTGSKCDTIANIPLSYGPDDDGHYVACADANCKDCRADLNVCFSCNEDFKRMELTTDPESVVCRLIDNIPESYGLIDGIYRKCSSGCEKCKANWYKCTECNSGLKLWQKDSTETVCETEPLIPDSFGPNSANPVVYVPCSPHCQDCKRNLLKCEYCEDNYSLWEKTTQNTLCEAPRSITGAYGPNTIGTYVPCSSNCLACSSNKNLCTQCSGSNIVWKKNDDEHVCALPAEIAEKYGKENSDSASSAFVPCADDRCKDCKADYQKCVTCDSGLSLWKQSDSNTVCEVPALIPETFGLNIITGIYQTCSDPHCNSCQADRTKCIRCERTWALWIKSESVTQCAKPQDIIGAYGLNGAGNYISCGSNCNACLADIDVCTECASTYFRWQKTDSTVVCAREAEVSNGFGLAIDIYIKCEPECAECKQDQTQCTKCNDPWVMWMKTGTTGICISKCDIPSGYGLDDDRYVKCKDANCVECLDNFQVCKVCKTTYVPNIISATETECKANGADPIIIPTDCPVGCQTCNSQDFCTSCVTGNSPKYYMWEKSAINHICITKGQITDGFGINFGVSDTVLACEAHCLKCKESRYICTECDKKNGYAKWFKSVISTICEKPANIPVDNGFNITPDQYESCFDGCLDCANNKAVCMKCDATRGLRRLLLSATDVPCVTYGNIPFDYGIRELEDSEVILCPSEICSGKICPSNGICNPDDNPGSKRVKSTSYDFRTVTATITFFNDTDRNLFIPESVMFIGYVNDAVQPDLRDIKYTYYYSENSGISYVLDTDGKDYQLSKLVVKSRARQAKQTASSAMHSQNSPTPAEIEEIMFQFDDIEFTFTNVFLIPNLETTGRKKSSTATMSNVLQYILKLTGFVFKVLLIPLDFFLAFTVDWVVATFSYLRLLSAPHVIKPSNIIHYLSSRTLFGFTIPNPYKEWANAPECNVPMSITLHSLQCSLFYNYGHNLNILLGALVLSIVVYTITSLTLWLINNPNDVVHKWTKVVRYFFGFRYFLLFMHGVFLDLFGLMLLNMTAESYSESSAVGAGLGLSIALLVFYVAFYSMTIYSIHVKIDLLKAGQSVGLRPALTYFSFLSDPFRFDGRHPWLLYMALFWPVKSAIVIIIAIAARHSGLGQTIPIFIIEVVGLLILLATRAKKGFVDNAFDIVFQTLLCVYIGTEMVLSGKDEMADLQDSAVSVFMAVIIYSMAVVAILYVIFRAIRAFARLNTNESIPNVLLPPVIETQEASVLLDQSVAWTVEEWR